MQSDDLRVRVMARYLRKKLEGRVLAHVLDNVCDDDLVAHYERHEAMKRVPAIKKIEMTSFLEARTVEVR